MRIHRHRSLLFFVLCAFALSSSVYVPFRSSARADNDEGALVRIVDGEIEYRGLLTAQAIHRVFALYADATPTPRRLRIASTGGSAEAGMELGAWMVSNAIDVHITGECLSSCASYVFTAGRLKILGPTATLLWHGGATQPLSDEELDRVLDAALIDMSDRDRTELLRHRTRQSLLGDLRRSHEDLIERERSYFAMLGVDPRIATLGHVYERELLRPGERFSGWDYSLEDLAALGVHDVVVEGDRAWTPARQVANGGIYRLRLAALPDFKPMTAPTADAG